MIFCKYSPPHYICCRSKHKHQKRKIAWEQPADVKLSSVKAPSGDEVDSPHPGPQTAVQEDSNGEPITLTEDVPVDSSPHPPALLFSNISGAEKLPEDIALQRLEIRRLDMNASYIPSSQSEKEEEEREEEIDGNNLQPPALQFRQSEPVHSLLVKGEVAPPPYSLPLLTAAVVESRPSHGSKFIHVIDIEDDSSLMLDAALDVPEDVHSSFSESDAASNSQLPIPRTTNNDTAPPDSTPEWDCPPHSPTPSHSDGEGSPCLPFTVAQEHACTSLNFTRYNLGACSIVRTCT